MFEGWVHGVGGSGGWVGGGMVAVVEGGDVGGIGVVVEGGGARRLPLYVKSYFCENKFTKK